MDTTIQPILAKSWFKIAFECPTKSFYLDWKDEQNRRFYKNRMLEEAFLQFLAVGGLAMGMQSEELIELEGNQSSIN